MMAACALASARGRDGALYGLNQDASYVATIPSETFFSAAKDNLLEDLIAARDFDYMRACALLSITSIQYGHIEAFQLYLGHYFTLVGVHKFHNEAFWPRDITAIEMEERRRLVNFTRYGKAIRADFLRSTGQSILSTSIAPSFGMVMFMPTVQMLEFVTPPK
jgi:hypothetical protein